MMPMNELDEHEEMEDKARLEYYKHIRLELYNQAFDTVDLRIMTKLRFLCFCLYLLDFFVEFSAFFVKMTKKPIVWGNNLEQRKRDYGEKL